MPQRILGIDLGSYSLKAVLVEDSMRGHRVDVAREVRVESGEPETAADRFGAALRTLLDGLAYDTVVAAMPAEQVTTRFVTLPFQDAKKIAQTLPGELSDSLPFDLDESVYASTLEAKLEGGASLNLAAAAPRARAEAALHRLQSHGLDPRFLGVDVLQLYNLYTHGLQEDQSRPESASESGNETQVTDAELLGLPEARLLVDVGHERTLVLACSTHGIAHARVLRTGGRAVTLALAKHFSIDETQAEALKHAEGLVGGSRHPATSEAEEELAGTVQKGCEALVRELRRTIASIRAEHRVRIARIDLLGGGSRLRNLSSWLAEELSVPVQLGLAADQLVERVLPDPVRRPAFAVAMALTLRAAGDKRVSLIDLRQGDLAFAGRLEGLKERIPTMVGAVLVLVLLLIVNAGISYQQAVRREKEIDQEFCKITKATVGRELCEPKEAINAMRQPASELGNVKLPERSALNVAAELSQRTPTSVSVDVEEIDISPDRARVSGESPSFDAVDSLVQEYQKDKCYSDIKKSKLRKKSDGDKIEFQLAMTMECS